MKLGDEVELALWYDEKDCLDPVSVCSKTVKECLSQVGNQRNVVFGKIDYVILKPGDDRVPIIPRWLERVKDVIPRLLVARAKVIASSTVELSRGIIGDLDQKDLILLRVLTRRKYQQMHPDYSSLTDQQCDEIIDQLGMQVALEQLRTSTVH